jgi:LysR family transcriptional regulator, nod-box dependent transcriptional activator
MRFHQLDLNLLIALDALLTERNITLAGKRLHLSQSAMSSGLSRLRDYFGDELLVLVGRKMVPTPLAESLANPVRKILIEIQSTITAKPEFEPSTSTRRFSLMMSDYVATVLMTQVIQRAAELAPRVNFELLANNVAMPTDLLDRAEIDLLIMPEHTLPDLHPKERLFEDDYVCLAWSQNTVVTDDLTLERYLALGHVALQFTRGQSPLLDDWIRNQFGEVRRIEVIAMNFNLLPQLLIGTQRIATIQRRMAEYYAKLLPLKIVPPPLTPPPMCEAVQWHRSFDRDPGSVWLRSLLREVAQTVAPRL